MNHKLPLSTALCVGILCIFADTSLGKSGEWFDLFNGRDTSGWTNPYDWGEVDVIDGELRLRSNKKFFLVTKQKFTDFIFEGEVQLPEGQANSGFMFRCHVLPNHVYGYQAEVDGSTRCWSGGLYDEGRRLWIWPSKTGRTAEEQFLNYEQESLEYFAQPRIAGALKRNGWNRYRIACQGSSIKIEVNGVLITDIHDDLDTNGPIGIQHHGEQGKTYHFRKLRIKKLEASPAQ